MRRCTRDRMVVDGGGGLSVAHQIDRLEAGAKVLVAELAHPSGHRGREQKRIQCAVRVGVGVVGFVLGVITRTRSHGGGTLSNGVDNLFDLGGEANVQHVVGFIQAQGLDLVQANVTRLDEIDQTTRRRHQKVHSLGEVSHCQTLGIISLYHTTPHTTPHHAATQRDIQLSCSGWPP